MLAHEIEDKIKEMNKKLDANNTDYADSTGQAYSEEDYHKDASTLIQDSENIVFLEIYFKHFSDGRKQNIHKRLNLPLHLFTSKYIQLSEVVNELSNNL